jgi:hypothetical protein
MMLITLLGVMYKFFWANMLVSRYLNALDHAHVFHPSLQVCLHILPLMNSQYDHSLMNSQYDHSWATIATFCT